MMHDQYDCYGSRLHCAWHQEDEPDGYLRCGECWHSYPTRKALLEAWKFLNDGNPWRASDCDPLFCPLCIHDF